MSRFNQALKNLINYELLAKFCYKNSYQIPEIKKIILNLGIKKVHFKSILSVISLLEVISGHKCSLTDSKMSNISLKIRKGYPVGCFITLRNNQMFNFLNNINQNIFYKQKTFKNITVSKNKNKNIYNFSFENLLNFNDLEQKYELFQDFVKLDISIVTNSNSVEELLFLLRSYRFPLK